MTDLSELFKLFDPTLGTIDGLEPIERRLVDLHTMFSDKQAVTAALQAENHLIYSVTAVQPDEGDGALHYGIGCIMPGRIGDEYHMTKGHLHSRRAAAEVYIGLQGEGLMLLEDERTGSSRTLPLQPHSVLYVPGATAHRTINIGASPLTYLGIYPADAGHDYGAIAERNFRQAVICRNGEAVVVERSDYLRQLERNTATGS